MRQVVLSRLLNVQIRVKVSLRKAVPLSSSVAKLRHTKLFANSERFNVKIVDVSSQ